MTRRPLLEFSNTLGQFRQAGKPRVLLLEFIKGPRRRAPNDLGVADCLAIWDPGLAAYNGFVLDGAVVSDSHLPSDGYTVPEGAASRDARLRGNNGMCADLYVVSDMNQVVDLHSFADLGRLERTAVDRRIATDFDVVADFHPTDLREFLVTSLAENVPKTIAADYDARVQLYAIAEPRASVESDTRMQPATFPNASPPTQKAERFYHRSRADLGFLFQYGVGAN